MDRLSLNDKNRAPVPAFLRPNTLARAPRYRIIWRENRLTLPRLADVPATASFGEFIANS